PPWRSPEDALEALAAFERACKPHATSTMTTTRTRPLIKRFRVTKGFSKSHPSRLWEMVRLQRIKLAPAPLHPCEGNLSLARTRRVPCPLPLPARSNINPKAGVHCSEVHLPAALSSAPNGRPSWA